ncbi:ATP-binding cassette domain-containing protein [Nocardioides sp. NPDC057767]|uniref:ATP-binding cassette domain-containing protein n=1 Tax=unclassified Nocardioides TaxID=2615069 RepID=UPI00366CAC5B
MTTTTAPARPLTGLLGHLGGERRAIAATIGLVVVSQVCLGAISVLLAAAVGHAVVLHSAPPSWFWALLAGLVVLRAVLTWGEMDASHALAFRVLARLRMALFDRYAVALPTRRRENVGRAASTAMSDTERLEFFYAHTVAQLAAAAVNALLGLVLLAVVEPVLALVTLTGLALVLSTVPLGRRRLEALGGEVVEATGTLSDRVVDVLGGLREVLGYGIHGPVRRQIRETGAVAARAAGRLEITHRVLAGAREAAVTLVGVGVLVGVIGRDVAAEHVAALVVLALATVAPVADASATCARLPALRAAAARVGTELARPAALTHHAPSAALPEGPLGLTMSGVGFGYDDRRVLDGFDLTIAPGEHVGLRGASGAGKSTVVALASRLWDPDAGTVALTDAASGQVAIAAVSDTDLRAALATVEQDGALFTGTVREAVAAPSTTDAEIEDLLARLGLAGTVTPESHIGEGGLRLSGGQRARLRLARAVLHRPRILLLDEPTADLDEASARLVTDLLGTVSATMLVVSHRHRTLAAMDRVVDIVPPGPSADPANPRRARNDAGHAARKG